ncbi:MAG: hypothetical protein OXN27_14910 [Candidatus Poribacteria bacterium]|nr:hypothetical protein [Candidatus Poribacteria bacterium]
MTFMDLIQELLTFVALIPLILILLELGKPYDLIVKKLNLPKSRFDDRMLK